MLSSTLSPMLERMAVSRPRCLSCELPGEHGGVLGGPHAGVPEVQFFGHGLFGRHAGIAEKLLPEGDTGELAFVVGVAVGPVEALKAVQRQPGEAQQGGVRLGILRPGQYHSIVEDNRAQSQCPSR